MPKQLPVILSDEDQENLKVLRVIYPSLTSDAAVIRDSLAFRVSTAPKQIVNRARRVIQDAKDLQTEATNA